MRARTTLGIELLVAHSLPSVREMARTVESACTRFGRESFDRHQALCRHRHEVGYVAVVLRGGYLEIGDDGRCVVEAGDVLVHNAFETHSDTISKMGAEVLNLPLPVGAMLPHAGKIVDPDQIAILAERNIGAAAQTLADLMQPACGMHYFDDWPDLLAATLRIEPNLRIAEWAAGHGLAAATVSRGFAKAYGVSAASFRAESRARLAWNAVVQSTRPLADIAAETGFADQAHMTRSVSQLTGKPAGYWRHQRQIHSRQTTPRWRMTIEESDS